MTGQKLVSSVVFVLILTVFFAPGLTGCASGHDSSDDNEAGTPTKTNGDTDGNELDIAIDRLTLIASAPVLESAADDRDSGVTLTAIARDKNNNPVPDRAVGFNASSGLITPLDDGRTQANGAASAILTAGGNPAIRTITIDVTADSATDTIDIPVSGTEIMLDGPSALAIGERGDYAATLLDSNGQSIANQPVVVDSALGNTLSSASLQTSAQGVARFSIVGRHAGQDTLTVGAFGVENTTRIKVGGTTLTLDLPDTSNRLTIDQPHSIRAKLVHSGVAVAGETLYLTSSRGMFDDKSIVTDANGIARATLSSIDTGPATLSVATRDGERTRATVRFVATEAARIDLQAEPAIVDTNGDSTLTAIVRDDNNNPVGDVLVEFTIEDTSGGRLQPAQATTNANGRATAIYTAGESSADRPSVITARVAESDDIHDRVSITVAGQALRIALGTRAEIATTDNGNYALSYTALVTDAAGNPVDDANFQLSVVPVAYQEGYKRADTDMNRYTPAYRAPKNASDFGCANEDRNRNGILDSGEDLNNNGTLDPGNVASVPRTAALEADGTAEFSITYPKNFSDWVKVRLRAEAAVQGSETTQNTFIVLPAAVDDVRIGIDGDPPGKISPFGTDGVCVTTYDSDTGEEPTS